MAIADVFIDLVAMKIVVNRMSYIEGNTLT